jgi:hypothetical protein
MGKNYNVIIKITNLNEFYLFPCDKTKFIFQHQLLLINLNIILDTNFITTYFIHEFPEAGIFPSSDATWRKIATLF